MGEHGVVEPRVEEAGVGLGPAGPVAPPPVVPAPQALPKGALKQKRSQPLLSRELNSFVASGIALGHNEISIMVEALARQLWASLTVSRQFSLRFISVRKKVSLYMIRLVITVLSRFSWL